MSRLISFATAALIGFVMISCSPRSASVDEQPSPAASEAVMMFIDRDAYGLASIEESRQDSAPLLGELRSLRWESIPPSSQTGLETAQHAEHRVQITKEHFDFIQSLGEQYEQGEMGEDEYVRAMLLIDALMSGILRSHEDFRVRKRAAGMNASQSVLTYAALARGAIDDELVEYGLGDRRVLTDEHREILKVAARDMKYELFDEIP